MPPVCLTGAKCSGWARTYTVNKSCQVERATSQSQSALPSFNSLTNEPAKFQKRHLKTAKILWHKSREVTDPQTHTQHSQEEMHAGPPWHSQEMLSLQALLAWDQTQTGLASKIRSRGLGRVERQPFQLGQACGNLWIPAFQIWWGNPAPRYHWGANLHLCQAASCLKREGEGECAALYSNIP